MPIYASAGSGGDFTPAPAGLSQAVCVDVVDMGLLKVTYAGVEKTQHKVRLVWQLEDMMSDGKPFLVQKRYTLSLHEKANLRKDLESWRGRVFTPEELIKFDVETVIGANAQLNIQHTQKDGKTYANVVSIVPLGRGMQKIEGMAYVRVQDRTEGQAASHDETPVIDDDIPF
jgi:uncharacterized Zn-binding protein involved in type VI secretion